MAFKHSKNSYIEVDDESAVNQDLSCYLDTISGLPGAPALSEVTNFCSEGAQFIPGLENVTFSTSGSYDPAAGAIHEVIAGMLNDQKSADPQGPYPFRYGPEGNTTGMVQLSGNAWISNYEVASSVQDKISLTIEWQVDGQVTLGTWA